MATKKEVQQTTLTINELEARKGLELAVVITKGLVASRLISLNKADHDALDSAYVALGKPPIGVKPNQN